MKKWEYKTLILAGNPTGEIESILNEEGEDGWEVIQVNERDSVIYLKREKTKAND